MRNTKFVLEREIRVHHKYIQLYELILRLYVRDTESRCKNTENIGNKRITYVKNLILRNKIQQIFSNVFRHTFISR